MKSAICVIFTILLFGCASTSTTSSSSASLTFTYTTVGILEGYDHTSKLVVYEDGNKIAESSAKKESEGNSITIPLSSGTHNIRAVLNSQYEGNWEEHLKANDYSIDCLYEASVDVKGKKVITLVFDIGQEKTIIK
jgi:hypothetical protein